MMITTFIVCIPSLQTSIFVQFYELVYVILTVGVIQKSCINPNMLNTSYMYFFFSSHYLHKMIGKWHHPLFSQLASEYSSIASLNVLHIKTLMSSLQCMAIIGVVFLILNKTQTNAQLFYVNNHFCFSFTFMTHPSE